MATGRTKFEFKYAREDKTGAPEEKRCSVRLAQKLKNAPPPAEMKKKPVAKRPTKAKKVKQTENGNKTEEPKAEATDAN